MATVAAKKQLLLNIYQATPPTSEGMNKFYNIFNLASLLLGLRPGIILGSFKPSDIPQIVSMFTENGLVAKKYPVGPTTIVITRPDISEELKDAYARLEDGTPRNALDIDTGHVMGYFNPIPLSQAASYPVSVGFRLKVKYLEKKMAIKLFPQKVKTLEPYLPQLEEMKTRLQEGLPIILPDGFSVESIELETSGAPSGGRRTFKVKRKSKGLRRKGSRKKRGSS